MNNQQRINPIQSANNKFKESSRNRFLVAVGVAVISLVLFFLIGPNADEINKKFEYIGAPGDLTIMDAISIDDGREKVHQLPKSLQKPPPPSIIEAEEEETSDEAIREIPKPLEQMPVENPLIQEVVDLQAKEFTRDLVSMATPMQSSRNYFIKHMERPVYPLDATEEERRTAIIYVKVAWFVAADGTISDLLIQETNGGSAFISEVLKKMKLWIIGFYIDPGPGIWMHTTWNFKSPYINHSPGSQG